MSRLLPWLQGLERTRSTSNLSARVRCYEAIAEAQSSLEQYSGIPVHPPRRRWQTISLALLQRLSLAWKWSWSQGPAVWIKRIGLRNKNDGRVAVQIADRPAHALFSWSRAVTHLVLLFILCAFVFGGSFEGVLAQPVQSNQNVGDGGPWRWLNQASEDKGVLSTYTSIPALPIMLQRPYAAATKPDLAEGATASDTPSQPLRTGVISYTVEEGDSLIGIADNFGLSAETLYWYNELESADDLSIGQVLKIPPMDGILHAVEEGDTLNGIAEEYEVRKGNLISYAPNNLREPYDLEIGQVLFVPGGVKPIPVPVVEVPIPSGRSSRPLQAPAYASLPGGERFSWPAEGTITDRFGWTGSRWHTGLDIAISWGTPVYAAAAGTVMQAGWNGNYGYSVVIDHGEGWATRYGHMAQSPEVSAGQWVERGQLIGFVGCTGWCTGPHVHFEVIYQGAYQNPLDYLW